MDSHKTDGRSLKASQLTELRKRAVEAVQSGMQVKEVAKALRVTQAAIYSWLSLYRAGGWHKLDAKKRGGRPPKLDAVAMRKIYETIADKDPRQLKFKFALWTSKMIRTWINKEFRTDLSKASVCRLLNQLGLSPQRPLWRAWQQDPEKVDKWMNEDFPQIRAEARMVGATIFFGDEAGVKSTSHGGTTWAPRGETPVIRTTGARFGINILSAVSNRGDFRFMLHEGSVTTTVFILFLKRLICNSERPIYLVVDGHPTHKSKAVRTYLEGVKDKLKLFLLPGYSPELNPDEFVWNDLKSNCIGRMTVDGPEQLKKSILSHLRSMQQKKSLIRSFFLAPETCYAAAG